MRYFVVPAPGDMENTSFPCGACNRRMGPRMKAVQCAICNYFNHIKCDGVDSSYYEKLKKSASLVDHNRVYSGGSVHHYCGLCRGELFPFQTVQDEQYMASIIHGVEISDDLNLEVGAPPRLRVLFNELNDRNEDSPINCEYYDYSKPIPNSKNKNKSFFI